ncbi:hypothetical protein QVD17_20843 [Tagetes erecta]|uniref:KIB1-4 beta-propeller domain-containing protein n=1 Tax=Tagetes erecta TaxID=13708 RepID=A0AAD8NYK7_TARER|nr:hypothetical protein QVD17_20843 [Tagetes erecta]
MNHNWSILLPEILNEIAAKLTFYEDFINFLCVCSSWRSSVTITNHLVLNHHHLPSMFPMLMLAESKTEEDDEQDCRSLFLLSSGIIRKVKLPEARWQPCVSTHGWLLTTGEEEFSVKLVHPLSRTQIDLPQLYMFHELYFDQHEWMYYRHFMRRVVFTSSNPNLTSQPVKPDPSFRVIVIWGETLGFCRLGDASWTRVNGWEGNLFDITYHKSRKRLYVLATAGTVYECDILNNNSRDVRLSQLTTFPGKEFGCLCVASTYLLEWGDNSLLMITRERKHYKKHEDEYTRFGPYSTKGFQCFVFSLSDGKWSKITSLGNKAVFLGFNSSFATNAGGGLKGDCIYFTDDHYEPYLDLPDGGGADVGVYHMFDGSIEAMFDSQETLFRGSPPLWLQTSNDQDNLVLC